MLADPIIVFLNTYGVFLLVVLSLYFAARGKKGKRVNRFTNVLFSVAGAIALSILVKTLFGYPRPYIEEGSLPVAGLAATSTFPSSHTAVAFAAATSVAIYKRRVGLVLLILAFLVGGGRIVANVHYPVDVLTGIIIGVTLSLFVQSIFRT